mmetsp:Transcript_13412/g.29128  ORF Transcript_13412/g.29128 Transcript_13412/m.29128 type:complete len:258 (-) Transcript_13412:3356-4129(-)
MYSMLQLFRQILWNGTSISWKCAFMSNVVFWPLSVLCLWADRLAATGGSSLLIMCKLQPDQHLCWREKIDLMLLAAFNMLFVAPFLCSPVFEYIWNHTQGSNRLSETDEWIWTNELLIKIPLHALITEVAFYSVHFLLHHSTFLYRHIHKVHHRFVAPTAMAYVYAHPLEFAVGNIFPIYLGCMLTNAHPISCHWIWFPLAMAGTCKGHCGYRIMGSIDPHDVHHLYFRHNYGGMSLLDRVFGTLISDQAASFPKRS